MNAVLLMLAAHLAVMSSQFGSDIQVSDQLWNSYKLEHDKQYSTMAEEALRRQVFAYNHHKAEKYNRENPDASFKLGTSHLSDMTDEEFDPPNEFRMPEDMSDIPLIGRKEIDEMMNDPDEDIPDEVDWRKVNGIVSPVKNEGKCGSCWAFSATGVLEGQQKAHHFKGNSSDFKLIPLSEQELLDCDLIDDECQGGGMMYALDFVAFRGGIMSQDDYPYEGKAGKCRYDKTKNVMTNKGYKMIGGKDEQVLKKTVAKYGPVAIAIENSKALFNSYKSGVLDDPYCRSYIFRRNLLIVGYGTTKDGKDYWIVKNSWGTKWGEDGYIRMSRNKYNQCGIASWPTIATF